MVWSVFNCLLTQKLPRKAKVALGCLQYKKLLKTLKVAEHNLFMSSRRAFYDKTNIDRQTNKHAKEHKDCNIDKFVSLANVHTQM